MAKAEAGRREAGKRRRRQVAADRILDAALEVLTTDGYEALTLARVADQLDYAVGALYRYFPAKDALVVAIQRRVVDGLRADLLLALARVDEVARRTPSLSGPTLALVRIFVASLVQSGMLQNRPAFFALISMSMADPRELIQTETARDSIESLMALTGEVARLIDDLTAAQLTEPGDGMRRAVLFWAAHHGVLQIRKLGRFGIPALDPEALSFDVVATLLVGWGAPRAELREAHRRARKILEAEPKG